VDWTKHIGSRARNQAWKTWIRDNVVLLERMGLPLSAHRDASHWEDAP
jgi:hypothetical protein